MRGRWRLSDGALGDPNWSIAAVADMNADGKPDIIWHNRSTGQNVIWFMNGTSYSSYAEITRVSDLNWRLEMAFDVDGDGNSDLIWRNYATGQNVIWLMNGTTIKQSFGSISVTDVNWRLGGNRQ